MRSAVLAVIVFALVVAGLVLIAVEEPASALGEPTATAERLPPTPMSSSPQTVSSQASCPQPGEGGPSLTGCPDSFSPATPAIGMGDLRRIESLPPQGWP